MVYFYPISSYGWNSLGLTSLLDKCHQNVCTLGLLTRSVLIKIVWVFLRLVRNYYGENDIKKYQEEGVPKNLNFPFKIGYNSGCNMKYTWLLKV